MSDPGTVEVWVSDEESKPIALMTHEELVAALRETSRALDLERKRNSSFLSRILGR